jgi:metal-responsive CopG/Arc/MetJ family transcriptional regulator
MARILVSMPDSFLKGIDETAEKEQRTRSELIREALRRYMDNSVPSRLVIDKDILIK